MWKGQDEYEAWVETWRAQHPPPMSKKARYGRPPGGRRKRTQKPYGGETPPNASVNALRLRSYLLVSKLWSPI